MDVNFDISYNVSLCDETDALCTVPEEDRNGRDGRPGLNFTQRSLPPATRLACVGASLDLDWSGLTALHRTTHRMVRVVIGRRTDGRGRMDSWTHVRHEFESRITLPPRQHARAFPAQFYLGIHGCVMCDGYHAFVCSTSESDIT